MCGSELILRVEPILRTDLREHKTSGSCLRVRVRIRVRTSMSMNVRVRVGMTIRMRVSLGNRMKAGIRLKFR